MNFVGVVDSRFCATTGLETLFGLVTVYQKVLVQFTLGVNHVVNDFVTWSVGVLGRLSRLVFPD